DVRVFVDFPWLLSPAAAIFLVVLGLNLVFQPAGVGVVYNEPDETGRGLRTDSPAIFLRRSGGHNAAARGARALDHASAVLLHRPRVERRSGADGRLRI